MPGAHHHLACRLCFCSAIRVSLLRSLAGTLTAAPRPPLCFPCITYRSGSQLPPPAPSESQLQTGWLFRSQDEDDYPAARTLASPAPPSRSPVLVAALLPILVPLSAAAMFFAARGLDLPIDAYLPKQVSQLENLLPKTEALQAAVPKPPTPPPSASSSVSSSTSPPSAFSSVSSSLSSYFRFR